MTRYSTRDLARDTYQGFKLRPVVARPIVQPIAEEPVVPWYERSGKVKSLVGSLPRSFDVKRTLGADDERDD